MDALSSDIAVSTKCVSSLRFYTFYQSCLDFLHFPHLGQVSFRLLMFRPFIGEVLVGKISGYDEKGLQGNLVIFLLIYCLLIGLQVVTPCLDLSAYI